MNFTHYAPPLLGILGLLIAFYIYRLVKKYPEGEGVVADIAEQIHLGAMVFIKIEYTMLAKFALVLLVFLFLFLGLDTAICFVILVLEQQTKL